MSTTEKIVGRPFCEARRALERRQCAEVATHSRDCPICCGNVARGFALLFAALIALMLGAVDYCEGRGWQLRDVAVFAALLCTSGVTLYVIGHPSIVWGTTRTDE